MKVLEYSWFLKHIHPEWRTLTSCGCLLRSRWCPAFIGISEKANNLNHTTQTLSRIKQRDLIKRFKSSKLIILWNLLPFSPQSHVNKKWDSSHNKYDSRPLQPLEKLSLILPNSHDCLRQSWEIFLLAPYLELYIEFYVTLDTNENEYWPVQIWLANLVWQSLIFSPTPFWLVCSLGLSRTHYLVQDGPELKTIILSQSLEHWDWVWVTTSGGVS